jgi:hypothetical protein
MSVSSVRSDPVKAGTNQAYEVGISASSQQREFEAKSDQQCVTGDVGPSERLSVAERS